MPNAAARPSSLEREMAILETTTKLGPGLIAPTAKAAMMLTKMPAEDIGNLSFGLNERQGRRGGAGACRWSSSRLPALPAAVTRVCRRRIGPTVLDAHRPLPEAVSAFRRRRSRQNLSATWMPAGPRMTAISTGRKNRIIGTVSFGGRAAAFFSASFMRSSRPSWARTRSAWATGVP